MSEKYPAEHSRPREIAGALLGYLGLALAVFVCYREVRAPFEVAALFPPGSQGRFGMTEVGGYVVAAVVAFICAVLGTVSILLQRGTRIAWIVAVAAFALALAAAPLGQLTLKYVMAKYHLIERD